ncbi:MAG: hypothetical protein ABIH66_08500 [bacterium]
MNLRVWAEFLKPEDVLKKDVVGLLKRYDVTLGMAFPPGSMNGDYARLFGECEQAGVTAMVWALLPDEQGYWANERNAKEFSDCVEKIYDWADENKFGIPWLAVDLETPYHQMKVLEEASGFGTIGRMYKNYRKNRNRAKFREASEVFNRLAGRMRDRGVKTLAAALGPVAADVKTGRVGLQDALETPVSTVDWDVVSFMLYTSAMASLFPAVFDLRGARWYMYAVMRDMKEKLGGRAALSIGTTSEGKVSHSPHRAPEELLPDMEAALAAGIDDVAVFSLEGILDSPKPEAWFETLLAAEPKVPGRSLKSDAFRLFLQGLSKVL